jgi:hypothetical protein
LGEAEVRWANLLFCCLFLAFTFAGAGTQILAADVGSSREAYPDERRYSDKEPIETEAARFCYGQSQICRKICDLNSNFEDRFDGCPQSCESRVARCIKAGCYRWREREFLIAENFGGYRCP